MHFQVPTPQHNIPNYLLNSTPIQLILLLTLIQSALIDYLLM